MINHIVFLVFKYKYIIHSAYVLLMLSAIWISPPSSQFVL